jgi:glycosyltransferase involved in cell wall biosynthesis
VFGAIDQVVFVVTGVAHLCATLLLAVDLHRDRLRPGAAWTDPVAPLAVAGAVAIAVGMDVGTVVAVTAVGALVALLVVRRAADLWPSAAVGWSALLATSAAGIVVAVDQVAGMRAAPVTVALIGVGLAVSVLRTPSSLMQTFENWEVGLRRRWHRSRKALVGAVLPADAPFVTVQVPTHAEPPEIVIATLDALSRLEYPDFEVLLIDNNTADERLWRPVQEHCAELGPRFRFRHVEGITGAKAGALNWARPHVDPATRLVALVDADYQVEPRWLAETAGLFDDPGLGFVQCPHAYRGYAGSTYATMVDTGYEWAQATEMVSRNEHDAGITVGTMSLIRLETLDAAGGWAPWCQTEDSEFAIRAHDAGYSSLLLDHSYGRGLIPETFTELRKQRFRWTYGPGQEFRAHARRYLSRRSRLSLRQRVRHGHYGLVVLVTGFSVLSVPVGAALLVSMAVHHEAPALDPVLLLAVGSVLLARRVMRWLLFRTVVGTSLRGFVGGAVALMAVKPTMSTAAFSVLIGRPTSWSRTSKFAAAPGRRAWLGETLSESVLALGCAAVAIATPVVLPAGTATAVLALGFGWQTVVYLTAPLLAALAQRDLARSTLPAPPPVRTGPAGS